MNEMQGEPGLLGELAVPDNSVELIDPILPRDQLPGQGLLFDSTIVIGFDSTIVIGQNGEALDLGSVERLALAGYMRGLGISGPIPLPKDPGRCGRLLAEATAAVDRHRAEATLRAAPHISPDLVEKVAEAVNAKWVTESISALRLAHAADGTTAGEELEEPSLFNPSPLVPPFPSHP